MLEGGGGWAWPLETAAAPLLASMGLLTGAVDVVGEEEEDQEAGLSKCTVVGGKCARSRWATDGPMEESERASEMGSHMVPVPELNLMLVRCTGSRSDSAPLRSLGSVLIVAAIDEHALLECTPDEEEEE